MGDRTVTQATVEDSHSVAAVLAAAFDLDRTMQWMLRDPGERRRRLQPFFLAHVAHILHLQRQEQPQGELQLHRDDAALIGAALWLNVAASGEVPRPDIGLIEETLGPDASARYRKLDQQLHWHHPPDVRHVYLRYIGVAPARQGHGIGSRLLEAKLEQCDDTGTPVYLEATDKGSCQWYEQQEFRLRGDRFPLPAGPFVYPMWRQPQRQRQPGNENTIWSRWPT